MMDSLLDRANFGGGVFIFSGITKFPLNMLSSAVWHLRFHAVSLFVLKLFFFARWRNVQMVDPTPRKYGD
jgi:hypothetical protein